MDSEKRACSLGGCGICLYHVCKSHGTFTIFRKVNALTHPVKTCNVFTRYVILCSSRRAHAFSEGSNTPPPFFVTRSNKHLRKYCKRPFQVPSDVKLLCRRGTYRNHRPPLLFSLPIVYTSYVHTVEHLCWLLKSPAHSLPSLTAFTSHHMSNLRAVVCPKGSRLRRIRIQFNPPPRPDHDNYPLYPCATTLSRRHYPRI